MPDDTTLRTTIELVGEQQYRAAMAEINRQLRETKSALSAAAAEYANADAATRTSTAQADALTQSLDQQRERLALMQAQLEKVEAAYGKDSKAAVELRTKINNARAEMAKTEGQLRTLSDGLDTAAAAAQNAGEDVGGAARGFEALGDSAQRAQDDVQGLAGEIGSVVGQKLIEFEVGKKALEQLAAGVKWALGEAIDGQREYGLFLSGAGDPVLADARAAVQSEVDKTWAGRLDGTQTADAIEQVDTNMGNASLTNPDYVEQITNMAITLQERWGVSIGDLIKRADAMRNTFGTAWEDSFDLMTLGFQNAHDGGAQMLKVMEENAQMFKAMGYDADDMFSVIIAACNDENLGKDSNLSQGMTHLYNTVTSGSKESIKALQALGIEATDWPAKLQAGGDAAALAMQELLGALLSIEDASKRNELGTILYGDIWMKTGGGIASAMLAGYGQTIEAEGANAFVQNALLDNVGDAFAQAGERINQEAGKLAEPFVDAATEAAKQFSASYDEGKGVIGAFGDALGTGVQVLTKPVLSAFDSIADEASRQGTQAGEAWGENYGQSVADALDAGAQVTVEAPSIDDLLEQRSRAAGEGNTELVAELDAQIEDAASQAVESAKGSATLTVDDLFAARAQAAGEGNEALVAELDAQIEAACAASAQTARSSTQEISNAVDIQRAELDRKLAEINQAITDADIAGNYAEAASLMQEREQIIADIAQMAAEVKESYTSMGEDAAGAVEKQGPKMQSAADSMGQQAVNALLDKQPDMMDAGDLMGSAGALGTQAGLSDGYGIGENFGASVASGIRSQTENVRSAAGELARAGSSAARTTLQIHSPSRVGLDTGENYGGAVAEGIRRKRADVRDASAMLASAADEQAWRASPEGSDGANAIYARGAALAEAFESGYGARGTFKSPESGDFSSGSGISPDELAQALKEALKGLAWETPIGTFARLAEPEFSRASHQRVQATVKGSSASIKGW